MKYDIRSILVDTLERINKSGKTLGEAVAEAGSINIPKGFERASEINALIKSLQNAQKHLQTNVCNELKNEVENLARVEVMNRDSIMMMEQYGINIHLSEYAEPTSENLGKSDASLSQEDILWLQDMLNKVHYPCPVDGEFSARTLLALTAFQRANDLITTGNLNSDTVNALKENYKELLTGDAVFYENNYTMPTIAFMNLTDSPDTSFERGIAIEDFSEDTKKWLQETLKYLRI